jgi:Zn-dependent M16 (insulinase) family peptidase
LLAGTVGGFYAILKTGDVVRGTGATSSLAGRDWIVYRLKALDEKIEASLDLALRFINESDFSDQRRLRDLVLEMKNESDSSLAPDGHSYASSRSSRGFSRSCAVEEIWSGLEQLKFAHDLPGHDLSELSRILTRFRDTFRASGCIINITASPESLKRALSLAGEKFGAFGAPVSGNPASREAAAFAALTNGRGGPQAVALPAAEVFASPSLQVGFAALALPGASLIDREYAAELVLSHQLSTGALWEDIRMKGGAYGAFAYPNGVAEIFTCSTYRDPDPFRSINAFPAILRDRSHSAPDGEALEKAVIGSYAKETRPRVAAEKGMVDFSRFLYGVEDLHRQKKHPLWEYRYYFPRNCR